MATDIERAWSAQFSSDVLRCALLFGRRHLRRLLAREGDPWDANSDLLEDDRAVDTDLNPRYLFQKSIAEYCTLLWFARRVRQALRSDVRKHLDEASQEMAFYALSARPLLRTRLTATGACSTAGFSIALMANLGVDIPPAFRDALSSGRRHSPLIHHSIRDRARHRWLFGLSMPESKAAERGVNGLETADGDERLLSDAERYLEAVRWPEDLSRSQLYDYTHIVMFVADSGRHLLDGAVVDSMAAFTDEALALCLSAADYDLATEMMMIREMVGLSESKMASLSQKSLVEVAESGTLLRQPEVDSPDIFDRRLTAEMGIWHYHLVFVLGMYAATRLRARPSRNLGNNEANPTLMPPLGPGAWSPSIARAKAWCMQSDLVDGHSNRSRPTDRRARYQPGVIRRALVSEGNGLEDDRMRWRLEYSEGLLEYDLVRLASCLRKSASIFAHDIETQHRALHYLLAQQLPSGAFGARVRMPTGALTYVPSVQVTGAIVEELS